MLRIRLRRTGKKKQASYRVVVADKDAPRDGAFVEVVGHYNPRSEPQTFEIDEERVRHWLSVGAQPSETVHRLLFQQGITTVDPPKRPTKPSKAEAAQAEAARAKAEAEAAAQAQAEQTAAAPDAESGESTDPGKDAPANESPGA